MTLRPLLLCLLAIVVPLCGAPVASTATTWTAADPLLTARQCELRSPATGRTYRILVSVPDTPPPPEGYPVLYLLDGHASFPLATVIARERSERGAVLGIDPGLIVGIVHVKTDSDANPRADDFTPPSADLSDTGDTLADKQGGADRFLDFIEHELKPAIATEYPVNSRRQTLFGHSYGGLFTLHTLFTRPALFQRYVAASPSIWWNHRQVLTERDTFIARTLPELIAGGTVPQVVITVGDQEQTPLPHHLKANRGDLLMARRMVDNARELAASLQQAGIRGRFYLFENENHGTTRAPAINHTIRVAFTP